MYEKVDFLKVNTHSFMMFVVFVSIIVFTSSVNSTINRIFALIFVASGIIDFAFKKEKFIKCNTAVIWYFIYLIFLTFSTTYAIAPPDKVKSIIVSCSTVFVLSFILSNSIETRRDIEIVLKAFMVAGVIQFLYMISIYGLDTIHMLKDDTNNLRIGDDVSNSNSVGMSLSYSAIIASYFLLNIKDYKSKRMKRIPYVFIILLTSSMALLSGSRKALAILLFGFLIMFYFGNNKGDLFSKLKKATFVILILSVFYIVLKNVSIFHVIGGRTQLLIDGVVNGQSYDHSTEARVSLINRGFNAFLSHPFLGQGPYSSYNYFGTYSHNNFIEVLMNTGVIGFILFYIPYYKTSVKLVRSPKNETIYWILFILFTWVFLGGFGMVTYYSKSSIFFIVITNEWLSLSYRNWPYKQ